MNESSNGNTENDIAIIGMACRFPGANTPGQFWENLRAGKESLTSLTDEELGAAGVTKEQLKNSDYVKSGMFLEDFDAFDGEFFGFSPLDSKILDPQHRHFLECSWEAFEDAGYVPGKSNGAVGVFAGSGYNSYLSQNLLSNEELVDDVGFFLLRHTGNDKDFLATRVSYLLNLKGPSVNVQTACSTSLVAIHMAGQSLLNAECDMALAGGVTIDMPHKHGYLYKESEILSPDGHCRPFDADSKGTVFGSGVGCILLKRYDDAVNDNDNIHAVIKGTAINNDGSDKVSYLAPSVDGQISAIQEALDIAEIDPTSVSYIECHGTGTPMGDPIEVEALTQAYSQDENNHKCGIGSVKSNIGHTDTAAGVASLIKVVQSLKHKQLAPTLHYQQANPSIDFDNSPFYVNAALSDWHSDTPLRAGVSSLGVGGTNAHVILEESIHSAPPSATAREELVLLSAKSELSLQKYSDVLAEHLDQTPDLNLRDISYTLAAGRQSFRHRTFAIAEHTAHLSQVLDAQDNSNMTPAEAPKEPKSTALMFAGGGSQHANMGRELYHSEPVYRDAVDECLELIKEFTDYDLLPILYPDSEQADTPMVRPSRGLPALFITQFAQTRLWQSWGIPIDAMIGHSMGENTAACLAGVFSLKDALGLVSLRGKLFETVERGGMISVSMSAESLAELTEPMGLDIAASNAPDLSVASGQKDKLNELQTILENREITFQQIHIDVAAHSRMLENILEPFRQYLQSIQLNIPNTPFISNLNGQWITAELATDPEYWVDHLRHTVVFDTGIKTLIDEDKFVFLEVGPGKTLSSLARLQVSDNQCVIEPSMPHIDDDTSERRTMLHTMGRLWQGGAVIQHHQQYADCRKVSLPTYQFAKTKHWVEPENSAQNQNTRADSPEQSFYQPVWQRAPMATTDYRDLLKDKNVLILSGMHEVNEPLSEAVIDSAANLITASPGKGFSKVTSSHYTLDLRKSEDYVALLTSLSEAEMLPDFVIHTLALESGSELSVSNSFNDCQYSFDSLFHLAHAMINADVSRNMKWLVLTQATQQLAGESIQNPLQALTLGPCKVIPAECSNITCRAIDLPERINTKVIVPHILETLETATSATLAYRGNAFFTQSFQNTTSVERITTQQNVRENGTYLITGGTGGLGLIAAETLSADANINLVLLSRSALPAREQWQQLIDNKSEYSDTLFRLMAIEARGSKVIHYSADIGDLENLTNIRTSIKNTLGKLDGIIHTAGAVDDNLLALKDIDQCLEILKPKVLGTLVLNQVFDLPTLDFFLLYSSISSFTGLPGQIDYAAANSFLDAFAHYQTGLGSNNVTSINWPAWREDGMAARMLSPSADSTTIAGKPASHPLLGFCTVDNGTTIEYRSQLSVKDNWMLDEHRLSDGTALIPGSGFMELARAAYSESTGIRNMVISNATFLLPFTVSDTNSKELLVTLDSENNNCFRFTICSKSNDDTVTHATGSICPADNMEQHQNQATLLQRCSISTQLFEDPDHHPSLNFGNRWASLKKVNIGDREALVELHLDDQYHNELALYALHPALLDMATGGAQILIPGYQPQKEFYVPVEYGSLRFNGSFSCAANSHVILKHHDPEIGTAVFDVAVYDTDGSLFLTVENFAMQRLQAESINITNSDQPSEVSPLLRKTIDLGLYTEEGTKILRSVINGEHLPQRIISIYHPDYVIDQLSNSRADLNRVKKKQTAKPAHNPDRDTDSPLIESTLAKHEAIEVVVVRSHLNEDGSRRLVAHYKPDDWESITVSELRKYARDVLDRNNVPQHFVEIDEIPLDPEGQIDRTALHDPYAPVDRHIAPRTPVEQQLADIWAEVLGADKVSVSDNFFDIGGHSLLSIRVIVRAQKHFSVQLDQAQMVLLTLEQQANEIQRQLPDPTPDMNNVHPAQLASSSANNSLSSTGSQS